MKIVVIDVSNSPSFEDAAVLDFFEKSTGNLLTAGDALVGEIRFQDWLERQLAAA
jgi:hypothetical protein